ncbi:MAG TPA: HlyD family type I secretion periplasmic adaptor subunit [Desulfovibrio sp.]|jgi:adhesin transport system membrane fusion protein|uniref:HlyD family type I secretion periplasmic adaptor subunit n=1 Tax=Desulfovibrio TaxID=872 RepID=UPI002C84B8CC|nr:HlyD family type I secretion periplasmic adaptor subunit [Desulfovibrio sp.]HMM37274.1 HlyD family type I secretion periplasmic adaptor subunit [Desulfovibrio sp.]
MKFADLFSPVIDPGDDTVLVSRATRSFFYLCGASCLLLFFWSLVGRLDIVSEAQGEVIPRSKVKRIQHLEGGIIRELLVREGDTVTENQPLVELVTTSSETNVEELQVRTNSLRVEIARLEAEEQGKAEPDYPEEIRRESPEVVNQSQEHFRSRRKRLESELTGQDEKIRQREKDVEEITARLRNSRHSLELLRQQIAISASLLKDQLTSKYKHLSFLQEESNLVSRIEEDSAAQDRSNSALAAARSERERILNAYHEEVQGALRKAQTDLLEFSQRLRKYTDELTRTVIRSPVAGVVKALYVVNVGEIIKPGMTIMDIVPAGDTLIIEAHLPIADIGYVQPGQRAVIKLASRDARRFGFLEGKVTQVSPDAISMPSGATYYRVLVETERDHFSSGSDRYQLYPGMRVVAGIHIGSRSVLGYILDPFLDTMSQGLQER